MLRSTREPIEVSRFMPALFQSGGTAWDLCEEVCRDMLEEPKRVNMTIITANSREFNRTANLTEIFPAGVPACGTAGCFAGWITLKVYPEIRDLSCVAIISDADRLLGDDLDYWLDRPRVVAEINCSCKECKVPLGGRLRVYVFDAGTKGDIEGKIGTQLYAESVVKRIREFMVLNEDKLKARRITIPVTD